MPFTVRVVAIGVGLWLVGSLQAAEPPDSESVQILCSYLMASQAQRDRLNGSIAEVSIDADVPALHKHGRLSALRRISRLGRITYDVLRYEGDNGVKNDLIARYLTAEAQARDSADASIAVTPANYKFAYKGTRPWDGRTIYVFDLKPRAKRKGLFRGMLWVDTQTYLPVRESGYLVKSPSVFIKKVEFTRDYQTANGVALVAQLDTTVETRVVGRAHMTVHYGDYRFEPSAVEVGLISTDSQ
jgi:hypothetical protein